MRSSGATTSCMCCGMRHRRTKSEWVCSFRTIADRRGKRREQSAVGFAHPNAILRMPLHAHDEAVGRHLHGLDHLVTSAGCGNEEARANVLRGDGLMMP